MSKSKGELTEAQHQLVNYILAQGIVGERARLEEFVNNFAEDSIPKADILKAIGGE